MIQGGAAQVIEAIVSLGGLAGLASLIASVATLVKARQVKADTETLRPNHGSSVADAVSRIETAVRGIGHQIGEVRRDLDAERADRRTSDESIRRRVETLERHAITE